MKLSDLVRLLNNIDQQTLPDSALVCQKELGELLRTVSEGHPQLPGRIADISDSYNNVRKSIDEFCQNVAHTRNDIQQLIEAMQPGYFAASYRLHDEEMVHVGDQYILDSRRTVNVEVQQYLASRMSLHSDWHHAALVIRPGQGEWLPAMTGADPLYLTDIRSSLLEPSVRQFTPEYQRRLRRYVLRENDSDGQILRDLPDGQFGFCVAVDFFHYKPFELIKLYLTEIFRKLKPGGVLAFTFNDCDLWGGVELTERSFMCYTPGGMICALCESIGFEIMQKYRIDHSDTWLELRRKGTLSSLRGGQSLAKIVAN